MSDINYKYYWLGEKWTDSILENVVYVQSIDDIPTELGEIGRAHV